MVESIISYSIKINFLVLFSIFLLSVASFWAIKNTNLDALPDLSPPQVIIQVEWSGQSTARHPAPPGGGLRHRLAAAGAVGGAVGWRLAGGGVVAVLYSTRASPINSASRSAAVGKVGVEARTDHQPGCATCPARRRGKLLCLALLKSKPFKSVRLHVKHAAGPVHSEPGSNSPKMENQR